MSVRSRFVFPLALGVLALAQPARAQSASLVPAAAPVTTEQTAPAAAPAAGPTIDAATVAVRHQETAAPTPARSGSAPGTALMIVGGAAVLVGLVIGGGAGGAIAVGGAVIGLVGLYQYLQ